jgi:putative membrane protein
VSAPGLPSLLVSHWEVSVGPSVAAIAAAAAYGFAARRVRGWPVGRAACFAGGLVAGVAAVESGVGAFDDRLLAAHMVQHMLLLLVAPLLLLAGRPVILALRAAPPARRPALARALARVRSFTGPVACLAMFTLVVLATHLPAFYDATLRHPILHQTEHALYLAAGLLLWWPVLDGDPVPTSRLGGLARLVYLLVAMAPMALIGAYLDRDPTLVYAPYGPAARALGVSPLTDQAQAGAIMWVGGSLVMMAVALWMALATMVAEERRQQHLERRQQHLDRHQAEARAGVAR